MLNSNKIKTNFNIYDLGINSPTRKSKWIPFQCNLDPNQLFDFKYSRSCSDSVLFWGNSAAKICYSTEYYRYIEPQRRNGNILNNDCNGKDNIIRLLSEIKTI